MSQPGMLNVHLSQPDEGWDKDFDYSAYFEMQRQSGHVKIAIPEVPKSENPEVIYPHKVEIDPNLSGEEQLKIFNESMEFYQNISFRVGVFDGHDSLFYGSSDKKIKRALIRNGINGFYYADIVVNKKHYRVALERIITDSGIYYKIHGPKNISFMAERDVEAKFDNLVEP